jgi:F-type H+-transporting ATPase subunit alpha
MKLDLAQFRDFAAFAQFGSDLDPATRASSIAACACRRASSSRSTGRCRSRQQVAMIYAVNEGHLDTVPVERVGEFQAGFLSFLRRPIRRPSMPSARSG